MGEEEEEEEEREISQVRVCVVQGRDLTLTPSTSSFMLTANRFFGSVLLLFASGLAIVCEASPRNSVASSLDDTRIGNGLEVGCGCLDRRFCLSGSFGPSTRLAYILIPPSVGNPTIVLSKHTDSPQQVINDDLMFICDDVAEVRRTIVPPFSLGNDRYFAAHQVCDGVVGVLNHRDCCSTCISADYSGGYICKQLEMIDIGILVK